MLGFSRLCRGSGLMRFAMGLAVLLALGGASGAAEAQTAIEGRVQRLEGEMRAVQRKVFPNGAGRTVEPQIVPDQAPEEAPGTPASAPLADLTARVAAVEGQATALTGQVEQLEHRLRQLEDGFAAYKAATDARLKALEDRAVGGPAPAETVSAAPPPVVATRPAAETASPGPAPAGSGRTGALASVQRPETGDPAEDGYVYGYRLWQAKLYPEARAALKDVATKYPEHRRASFAQNLLGRAYLDAGAPSLAAKTFLENYQKLPNGERAPESLYYLAQSLVKLKKPAAEVCRVYRELDDSYGSRISPELRAQVDAGRAASKCT
jgi:TolA-binding protein